MRFALAVAALASVASATTISVMVGANSTLTFQPSSVVASVGDTIAFTFTGANHTATQSTFAAPCTKMTGGIDSGFQPVSSGASQLPQYSFNVTNATAPLWFYCAHVGHCQQGMVFAVNPSANKTFSAFQAAAESSNGTSTSNSSSPTATSISTSTPTQAAPTQDGGAMKLYSGSVAGFVAVVGLSLGLAL